MTFAGRLSAAWSQQLRADVSVSLELVEPIRYEDFIFSLGESSCLLVLRVDPPGAQICLDLSLAMMFPLIDRLLGGQSEASPVPRRGLTQIERSLAAQIIERAVAQLGETWSSIDRIALREELVESTPTQLTIMPADEMVSVARFNVKLPGGGGGSMSLCLPAPVCDLLRTLPTPVTPAKRDADAEELSRNVLEAEVMLHANLATARLRLVEILTLQVGDVITTDIPADRGAEILVGGKPKFAARPVQLRGVSAIQITGAVA